MKLCFASIRLSATIKMGDKDDRPFVVANWPDAREKGGRGLNFWMGQKVFRLIFHFVKWMLAVIYAAVRWLRAPFICGQFSRAKSENDCQI